MATKNSYSPVSQSLTSTNNPKAAVPVKVQNLSSALWNLVLLEGIARLSAGGAALASATVVIWKSANAGSIGNADFITFTDVNGKYAITIPAATTITMKVYS